MGAAVAVLAVAAVAIVVIHGDHPGRTAAAPTAHPAAGGTRAGSKDGMINGATNQIGRIIADAITWAN